MGYTFKYDVKTNKITSCQNCADCKFLHDSRGYDCGCSVTKMKWLYQKYVILTDDEINFIEALNKITEKKYKYIARDTTGNIKFFETKPSRNGLKNYYNLKDGCIYIEGLLFPNIKFTDGLYDIENKCFIKE